jgi:phage-related protein
MIRFPRLKTGAVAQYPAAMQVAFRTRRVRFIDGQEQRFREYAMPLRKWIVDLSQLDESELASLEEFFVQAQGSYGKFVFTDPLDETEYEDCSLEQDAIVLDAAGIHDGRTTLTVRENRS